MRGAVVVLSVLSCVGLAACAGSTAGNNGPVAAALPTPAAAAEKPEPASAPSTKPRGRAAYRGTSAPPPPAPEPDHLLSTEETAMQLRTDCWMAVDHAKVGRDIDSRMAWVDKCIAEKSARP